MYFVLFKNLKFLRFYFVILYFGKNKYRNKFIFFLYISIRFCVSSIDFTIHHCFVYSCRCLHVELMRNPLRLTHEDLIVIYIFVCITSKQSHSMRLYHILFLHIEDHKQHIYHLYYTFGYLNIYHTRP